MSTEPRSWFLRLEDQQKNYLITQMGNRVHYRWWRDGRDSMFRVVQELDTESAEALARAQVSRRLLYGYHTIDTAGPTTEGDE